MHVSAAGSPTPITCCICWLLRYGTPVALFSGGREETLSQINKGKKRDHEEIYFRIFIDGDVGTDDPVYGLLRGRANIRPHVQG